MNCVEFFSCVVSFVSLCVSCWNLFFLYKLKTIEASLSIRKERLEVLIKFQDFYLKLRDELSQIETTWVILRNPQKEDEIENESKRLSENIGTLNKYVQSINLGIEGLFNTEEENIIKEKLFMTFKIKGIISDAKYHFSQIYRYRNDSDIIFFVNGQKVDDPTKISEESYNKSLNEIDNLSEKIKSIIDYDNNFFNYIVELKNKYCRINNILRIKFRKFWMLILTLSLGIIGSLLTLYFQK